MSRRRLSSLSVAELHRAWLAELQTEGPFLAVPPLRRVWPQGMGELSMGQRQTVASTKPTFDKAWDAWDVDREGRKALQTYRSARDAWVLTFLEEVCEWRGLVNGESPVLAQAVASSPDQLEEARATAALEWDGTAHALLWLVDPTDSLFDPASEVWPTAPLERMALMLRASGVPIGLVTDGRWWGLVYAHGDTTDAFGVADSLDWGADQLSRRAFKELLRVEHLFAGPPDELLPTLFAESVTEAEEITESLGAQVRQAVELLVQAFGEVEQNLPAAQRDGLLPDGDAVYEAAVTVMMRVVFLLFAEQAGLLPDTVLFTENYAMANQLAQLDERVRIENEESLDGTHLCWHRLLATSAALFEGVNTDDMRMPPYGGSLFDPDRFAFLTATDDAGLLLMPVSDRVMYHVLRSVQEVTIKQLKRRISFREMDVEQIGYIYEGLLGYTARRATELTIGLVGREGAEPEMPLATLEQLSDELPESKRLAAAIVGWVKSNQPAAETRTVARLTKALDEGDLDGSGRRGLLSVTHDPALRERLDPWLGVIRRDLRGRPTVVLEGGWLVVETPSRRTAGAHYTPKKLAAEVVEHALEPLVYQPGPYQTADESQWRKLNSWELLELRVADIACGSGAFLVAAARYLAERLVAAYEREGHSFANPAAALRTATREVVSNCLYGADINPMAIEMCKLSLWLVSLDRSQPFTFVDDKVFVGNSLLGITDPAQLRARHIDPTRASSQDALVSTSGAVTRPSLDVDHVLRQVKTLRQKIAEPIAARDPRRDAKAKELMMRDADRLTADLRTIADGIIAAGLPLGGKPGKKLDAAYQDLSIAVDQAFPNQGEDDRTFLDAIIDRGLTPTVETDYDRWKPLHWVIEMPEVFERGGFDAIVGNPPFLGGKKISPALGENLRAWFANILAGRSGNGDLVAYFFLRAHGLLNANGTLGLIATNTVAQGDTREVGLDQLVDRGFTITRAIQSRSWPAESANLEFAAVWGTRARVFEEAQRVADGVTVRRISTLLEAEGRVSGRPIRLVENRGIAFQGCIVLGKGFILEPGEAQAWIAANPRNAEVLFPYLNGEDLNSRPDGSASRWVIDFGERSESEARRYTLPWQRVDATVRPVRQKKDGLKYPRMVDEWWKYWNARPAMREAVVPLDEVLTMALVSNTLLPMRTKTAQVFSHKLVVFALPDTAQLAVLSSSLHQVWAIRNGSTMRKDVNYSPSDAFVTFPRPEQTSDSASWGRQLDQVRREIMLRRQLGLTKLYNLVNDESVQTDPDVVQLREIHVRVDEAVMEAYGWSDVPLDHGFHSYRQMTRWTVSPAARVEILDRLLEENHRRAAAQGAPPADAPEDTDADTEEQE